MLCFPITAVGSPRGCAEIGYCSSSPSFLRVTVVFVGRRLLRVTGGRTREWAEKEKELMLAAASACRQPRLIVAGLDDLLLKCKRTRTFPSTVLFLFKLSSIRLPLYRPKKKKRKKERNFSLLLLRTTAAAAAAASSSSDAAAVLRPSSSSS